MNPDDTAQREAVRRDPVRLRSRTCSAGSHPEGRIPGDRPQQDLPSAVRGPGHPRRPRLPKLILDTGPLVALLKRRDQHHRWAWDQWERMEAPLFTCEPVVAEACFLVQGLEGGSAAVLDFVRRSVFDLSFRVAEESSVIAGLMRKYGDVPMSLVDGCLVRMAERHTDGVVVTLDNDFKVTGRTGVNSFRL